MPTERFYFRECLKNELEQRRRKRDGYSLRSFAKSLEIQAPTLSAVLAGKRTLSQQSALQIIQKLKLSPLEESRFLDSLQAKRKRKAPNAVVSPMALMTGARYIEEEIYFHVIAEWEFYAILSLTEVKGFVGEPDWIAKSLGITSKRAADCLDSLLELGLLKRTKAAKKFEKSQGLVRTSEDVSSRALQLSHRESLEMGLRKLEILPVHKRDFSSVNLSIDHAQIPLVKQEIRMFRSRILKLTQSHEKKDSVYQLCVQFFPLTTMEYLS